MSGYHSILVLRRLEDTVNDLGFMFSYPKHRFNDEVDMVALRPKDEESLPLYCRDAELFCGTLEQLEVWLRGVEWARNYDMMLKVSDEKKRERKEQDLRNQNMMKRIKNEEVKGVERV